MRKKKEQKNDNKDSVCTSEYELGQLERPFRVFGNIFRRFRRNH